MVKNRWLKKISLRASERLEKFRMQRRLMKVGLHKKMSKTYHLLQTTQSY